MTDDIKDAMQRVDRAAGKILERCVHPTVQNYNACTKRHEILSREQQQEVYAAQEDELVRASLSLLNKLRRGA
ncbi:MAG: hypothetical protein WCJ18_00310 [Planctomycetota bacterium]